MAKRSILPSPVGQPLAPPLLFWMKTNIKVGTRSRKENTLVCPWFPWFRLPYSHISLPKFRRLLRSILHITPLLSTSTTKSILLLLFSIFHVAVVQHVTFEYNWGWEATNNKNTLHYFFLFNSSFTFSFSWDSPKFESVRCQSTQVTHKPPLAPIVLACNCSSFS